MNITIVLPCYNEEENIEASVRDVAQWMQSSNHTGDIIVVDDGSKDGSPAILKKIGKELTNLRTVRHAKNGGYGVAIRTGIDAATTEWIGFMDSDGQFHANDIDILIHGSEGYSFVTGRRAHRADGFVRNSFGKVLGGMNLVILGLYVRDVNCGMKIFKREIWKTIRPTHGVEKLFNTEMFLRLKRNKIPWNTINVPHYPRTKGTPTGGSGRVIVRMFKELWDLRTAKD